jgi:hypothetical protein
MVQVIGTPGRNLSLRAAVMWRGVVARQVKAMA